MIIEPILLLDEKRCRKNIKKMVSKFLNKGVEFRPMFKTHQSIEIGNWFKEYGVNKITVSSFKMAKYFSNDWNDITVAFPVNILEIDTINDLSQKIALNLLVESSESTRFLKKHSKYKVGVFIKIDVGYDRTGLAPENSQKIEEILSIISASQTLLFKGFLGHAGHTYSCRKEADIINIHEISLKILKKLKHTYTKKFPNCIVSLGDTPTCSVAENFNGLDEIRPGNFVFYDLTQNLIGSNSIDDIAVAIACPIVAINKEKNKFIIYGGGVHFSKDRLEDKDLGVVYGKVVQQLGLNWRAPIPNMFVSKLSQEHGTVQVPASEMFNYKIGDYLIILPVHSCMTANLMRSYHNINNNQTVSRL